MFTRRHRVNRIFICRDLCLYKLKIEGRKKHQKSTCSHFDMRKARYAHRFRTVNLTNNTYRTYSNRRPYSNKPLFNKNWLQKAYKSNDAVYIITGVRIENLMLTIKHRHHRCIPLSQNIESKSLKSLLEHVYDSTSRTFYFVAYLHLTRKYILI